MLKISSFFLGVIAKISFTDSKSSKTDSVILSKMFSFADFKAFSFPANTLSLSILSMLFRPIFLKISSHLLDHELFVPNRGEKISEGEKLRSVALRIFFICSS